MMSFVSYVWILAEYNHDKGSRISHFDSRFQYMKTKSRKVTNYTQCEDVNMLRTFDENVQTKKSVIDNKYISMTMPLKESADRLLPANWTISMS